MWGRSRPEGHLRSRCPSTPLASSSMWQIFMPMRSSTWGADAGGPPARRQLDSSLVPGGAVPLYVYRRGAGRRLSLAGRLYRAGDGNDYRACCPSPLCLQPIEVGVMSPLPPVVRLADFAASRHSRWPPPGTDTRGNASHAAGPQVNFYTVRLTPDVAKRTECQ
jgi:hypothetical protein